MAIRDDRPSNASSKVAYERFVVSVDGQAKSSFAREDDAQAESKRITDQYPRVVVHVRDGDRHLVREYPDKPGEVRENSSSGEDRESESGDADEEA
jgi:ketosteroid isomerase-like protein